MLLVAGQKMLAYVWWLRASGRLCSLGGGRPWQGHELGQFSDWYYLALVVLCDKSFLQTLCLFQAATVVVFVIGITQRGAVLAEMKVGPLNVGLSSASWIIY